MYSTLSAADDEKFLEQLKSRFKRTIKWNKYRLEMAIQAKTNNINYLFDPTFNKVNRSFVLSFENEEDRTFLSKHYSPKIEIKDFNVLTDGKRSFDAPIKKAETYENLLNLVKTVMRQLVIYWIINFF